MPEMPSWRNPANGRVMIWDDSSHSYVEGDDAEQPMDWQGAGQTLDPAIHSTTPKNPEQTGILASARTCPHCRVNVIDDGDFSVCEECEEMAATHPVAPDNLPFRTDDFRQPEPGEHERMVTHASACANCHRGTIGIDGSCERCQYTQLDPPYETPRELGPFPDVVPQQNLDATEHDFPSRTSASDMRSFPEHESSWEHDLREASPSLDCCPECDGGMAEGEHGAKCRSCGLKQPAATLAHHTKEGHPALLAPLLGGVARALLPLAGRAAAGAAAGGAAGGGAAPAAGGLMGSVGGLMGRVGPGMAVNAVGGGQQEPPQPTAPPQQPTYAPGALASRTAGPDSNESWKADFVTRGDDDNPEHDGTQGFEQEHSDSPEHLKDVDGAAGSDSLPDEWLDELRGLTDDQLQALTSFGEKLDHIIILADSDDDHSSDEVFQTIDQALEAAFPGYRKGDDKGDTKESSVSMDEMLEKVAARRPKLCPAHTDLIDHSLLAGSPQFGSFAPSNYGSNYCKSPDFDGKCKFKPNMTTQKYWDDKDAEYEQRKVEREQAAEQAKADGLAGTTLDPAEHDVDLSGVPAPEHAAETSEPAAEYAPGLSESPSAVGMPVAAARRICPDCDNDPRRPRSEPAKTECDTCSGRGDFAFEVNGPHHPCRNCNQMHTPTEDGGQECKNCGDVYSPEEAEIWRKRYRHESSFTGLDVGTAVRRRTLTPSHDDPVGVIVEMTTVHPSSPGRATVRFEDGSEESIPVVDLESADGGGAGHPTMDFAMDPGHPFEDEMSAPSPDMDPTGNPYNSPAGTAPYSYASVKEADHDHSDAQHSSDADDFDFGHGAPAHQSDTAVADDGQDEAGLKDVNGAPLREGSSYFMKSEDYSVPDRITIDKVAGSDVTYTIHTGDMDFQDTMSVADIEMQKFSFEPVDESPEEGSPEEMSDDVPAPTEHQHADDGGNLSDFKEANLSNFGDKQAPAFGSDDDDEGCKCDEGDCTCDSKREASLDDHFPWHTPELSKTAGKDYSSRELRELIEEGEGSLARNHANLDLSGTHYVMDDITDNWLW